MYRTVTEEDAIQDLRRVSIDMYDMLNAAHEEHPKKHSDLCNDQNYRNS